MTIPPSRLDPDGSTAKAGNGHLLPAGPGRIPRSPGTGRDFVRTILRMRAMPGSERSFERGLREAMDEISRVPGNVRQDLIRDADDPRTFLIISDWTDRTALDEFGRSRHRDRIMAAVREIRESAERHTYEVVQSIAGRGPRIRVMVTVTVGEGEMEAYERAYLKVAERVRMTPGHVQEELLWEPGTRTFHLFAEWEDEQSFNAWVDNPAHMEQTGPLAPYLIGGDFKRAIYHVKARPEAWKHTAESIPGEGAAACAGVPRAPSAPGGDAEPGADAPAIVGGSARPAATDVLIVGAGPAGLTAAIELARRGIACRVIEKRAEPSGQADKAIGIQCRTMEIWEDIGIVREAMDVGIWLNGQTVFVNGRKTHQIDWDFPELPFGHLGLPQYETERLLANCLTGHGVSIERGVELRDSSRMRPASPRSAPG